MIIHGFKVLLSNSTCTSYNMGAQKNNFGGSHVGVYASYDGWVGWSSFEGSLHAVPWGGEDSCSQGNSEIGGEKFSLIAKDKPISDNEPLEYGIPEEHVDGFYRPNGNGFAWVAGDGKQIYYANDCKKMAMEKGWAIWGYRTNKHKKASYRKSCFFSVQLCLKESTFLVVQTAWSSTKETAGFRSTLPDITPRWAARTEELAYTEEARTKARTPLLPDPQLRPTVSSTLKTKASKCGDTELIRTRRHSTRTVAFTSVTMAATK